MTRLVLLAFYPLGALPAAFTASAAYGEMATDQRGDARNALVLMVIYLVATPLLVVAFTWPTSKEVSDENHA